VSLLIDTYNVLHAWTGGPAAGDAREIAALAGAIARSRYAGSRLRLVCDGAPAGGADQPLRWRAGDAEVLYAGPGRDADGLIERLILEDTAPTRLIVVSSDRRIRKAARRRGAKSLASEEFLREVAASSPGEEAGAGPETGAESLDADAVAAWMREFGMPGGGGSARRAPTPPDETRRPRDAEGDPRMRPVSEGEPASPDLPGRLDDADLIDEARRVWPDRFDPDDLDPERWLGDSEGG